ncbi:carboxypeptidase-like regulatory domain-containing protein [Singulisphaera rosea]
MTIEGVVIDSAGLPVPGAVVHASLYQNQRERSVLADRDGAFQIEGVEPETEVILSAQHDELRTAVPVATKFGKGPITLKVAPGQTIAVKGRVLDIDGSPVPAATVRIDSRRRRGRFGGMPSDYERLTFDEDGHENLYTAADGRFYSPRRFSPDLEYRAVVEAEGHSPEQSQWIEPTKTTAFPDVFMQQVPRTRLVQGRVVDGAGTPVVGALVFQSGDGPARTSVVTDSQGRFQLPGVFQEPAVLFVDETGIRFSGYPIDGSSRPVVLTVRRNDDPADPPLRPLPPPLPRAEADALALRIIEPEIEGFLKPSKYEAGKSIPINIAPALLSITARIDPARTEDLVGRISLSTPEYNDLFRSYVAMSLFPVSPQRAIAVAETLANPLARSRFYCQASDAVPEEDQTRKLELLEKALQLVQASTAPAPKMTGLGAVGYRLLDLGDTSRGTSLLREGQTLAESLPKGRDRIIGGHLRGFAPKLARIDPSSAFAMIDALKTSDAQYYYRGIVLGLADRDPEKTEQFLARIALGDYRNVVTARIVGRMVAKDSIRARRIIDAVADPVWRATGLGLMARKLAHTDPKAAIGLIDETLDLLLRVSREGSFPEQNYVIRLVRVAAGLMPVAERLDEALCRRSFWKVAALRPPRSTTVDPGVRYAIVPTEAAARIALILPRYDRVLARQILEPVAKRVKAFDVEKFPFSLSLFAAAARIDPVWALELVERLPVGVANLDGFPRDQARRAVADILAGENSDPKNRLEAKYLGDDGDSKDKEP